MAKGWLNSMKLEAMPCRATQDGQVKVKSSDRRQPTWGGNGNPLHYSCLGNSMNSMKRENMQHWKMSFPGQKVSKMLLWKSRGQLLIVPGKKKKNMLQWTMGYMCLFSVLVSSGYNLEGWVGGGVDGRSRREGGSKGRRFMCTYGWFMLRYDRKQQNSIKQLLFNKKIN